MQKARRCELTIKKEEEIFEGKTVELNEANLVDLTAEPLGTETLRFGGDDNSLRQPVVRLFAPPLRAGDPELTLQLLYETVLRSVFVYNDGSHLPAQVAVTEHGVYIRSLLSAPNY